ncbi:hypothetical protein [Denitromonas iodatirespirans]|uniref:Uncharacterized protein n=1 Tax=Denitromonas iodatirespirans TaxID=2795389 RepID=A0A944H6C5_DENI1|nr:hypothetical protein [Denitromonas iodatirespirans]MBT0960039.1 hypothetical protein [Denitromonas iodatirespirans]
MTIRKIPFALAPAALCAALLLPVGAQAAGSDEAFNEMLGTMESRDTGSGWFDYYVEVLNQEIAYMQDTEAYGAAGPSGPLDGFNGYVAGFRAPDTGSRWMNGYVDSVNRVIREKQQYDAF